MDEKEIDLILDKYGKAIMIKWGLKGFKRMFPRLYRVIIMTVQECILKTKRGE